LSRGCWAALFLTGVETSLWKAEGKLKSSKITKISQQIIHTKRIKRSKLELNELMDTTYDINYYLMKIQTNKQRNKQVKAKIDT